MPGLTGAGTGTTIARAVVEEECSVMGARGGKGRLEGERARCGRGARAGCACACRPYGRGAHATAVERRSKRPARAGLRASKGSGGGRLWG